MGSFIGAKPLYLPPNGVGKRRGKESEVDPKP